MGKNLHVTNIRELYDRAFVEGLVSLTASQQKEIQRLANENAELRKLLASLGITDSKDELN